jgi:membrane protease YdiL (CAAX protease family)
MQTAQLSTALNPIETRSSLAKEVAGYLALTFGISWVLLVGAIKLGLSEEYLNIGVGGPAIGALLLSAHKQENQKRFSAARLLCFSGLCLAGWVVICLHYLWQSGGALQFHVNPRLLIPAAVPAWILSAVFSGNEGVRALVRRIVHVPNRWSLFGLMFFPMILGVPSIFARIIGAPLIFPSRGGSAMANVADGFVFFLYNLLFVGTEEEPGWRGFLLDRLQRTFSPGLASLLVWLPWALWHAPLDYFRPVRFGWVTYLLLRVVFMIPLTIILTWLYNRSGRSIQSTVILHASMNTVPFVIPYYQPAWFLLFVFAGYAVIADKMWSGRNLTHSPSTPP